ncbi:MAG: diguanylate cyclase [Enterocloster asparagiformis]|nr:diguanylate cyclase [Enterocloster asparagiformis]
MQTDHNKRKPSKLTVSLIGLSVVPLLVLGAVGVIVTSLFIYRNMRSEVMAGLKTLTYSSYEMYELMYPGGYGIENGQLTKGGRLIGDGDGITDYIKEISGADATLFYGDERMFTTILSEDGSRAVGTHVSPEVAEQVLVHGQEYVSDHVLVNGIKYFGYYKPLENEDHSIVGMVFVGRPRTQVMEMVWENIRLVSYVILVVALVTGAVCVLYSRRIIFSIRKTEEFLGKVAGGDITAEIDEYLVRRTDELGEMGRFAVKLQASIIDLVGRDPLTGMYNRRSCGAALENVLEDYRRHGRRFAVAIGDIDYFKRVNDTFGHQAGDAILKKLSAILTSHMERYGFVFRWGGEEFLFIYEDMGKEEAGRALAELQDDIRRSGLVYKGQAIQAAMTFGVMECREAEDLEEIIRLADQRMYRGKDSGRDRIVIE